MRPIQDRFDSILKGIDSTPSRYLLAVSGGVDSMCLASLFLHSPLHPVFAVAHCNFHLRGADSDSDEALVRDWCQNNGIQCFVKSFDTLAYASKEAVSIEMAAREQRYSWFSHLCSSENFSALAVAHNANDNAETLMLNLLRGTGLRGLCGMRECGTIPVKGSTAALVRPLLGFTREELLSYSTSQGLVYHEDKTNAETLFKRNKLRHLVFPVFKEINPSFLRTFAEEMSHFAQAEGIVDEYFRDVVSRGLLSRDEISGEVKVSISALREEKHVDYVLYRLLGQYAFPSNVASELAELIGLHDGDASETSAPRTLSGKVFYAPNFRLAVGRDELIISPSSREGRRPAALYSLRRGKILPEFSQINEAEGCMVIEGPGLYEFNGSKFIVEELSWRKELPLRLPQGHIQWDASKLSLPLLVRRWRAGDWLRPLGMKGRKKLSDLFVDLGFSLSEKERAIVLIGHQRPLPLETSEEETAVRPENQASTHVAAVLGRRIDESIKISSSTEKVIKVRFVTD